MIAMTAFISPFRADREAVRKLMSHGDFLEIYCKASLETCEARDVKGPYKKARAGEIKNYTGIDWPYEAPEKPEPMIDTDVLSRRSRYCGHATVTTARQADISDVIQNAAKAIGICRPPHC